MNKGNKKNSIWIKARRGEEGDNSFFVGNLKIFQKEHLEPDALSKLQKERLWENIHLCPPNLCWSTEHVCLEWLCFWHGLNRCFVTSADPRLIGLERVKSN